MAQTTPTEELLLLADKHNMTPTDQLELIKSFAEISTLEDFGQILAAIDEELAAVTAKIQKTPQPVAAEVSEMNAFFDRSLARANLSGLVHLSSDGPVFERVGYDTARLVIPKVEFHAVLALLDGSCEGYYQDSEIICGWYTTFADGSTAAIAIVGAPRNNGGPYVDAFLIIPEGEHITVPNPSLKPTRVLDQQFVFPYPDGTYKVVQLVPSTT